VRAPYRERQPGPLALTFLKRARSALGPRPWRRVVWHQQPWMHLVFVALPGVGAFVSAGLVPTHRVLECRLGEPTLAQGLTPLDAPRPFYPQRCELVDFHFGVFERRTVAERFAAQPASDDAGPTLSIFDGVGTTFVERDDPARDLEALDAWAREATSEVRAGREPAPLRLALPGLPAIVAMLLAMSAFFAWMSRRALDRVELQADLAERWLVLKVRETHLFGRVRRTETRLRLGGVAVAIEPVEHSEDGKRLRVESQGTKALIEGDEDALKTLATAIEELEVLARRAGRPDPDPDSDSDR
jgi:hypothetical protein